MRMTAHFAIVPTLFMKDDRAWLSCKAEFVFRRIDSSIEALITYVRTLGRIKAHGKQELFTLGSPADRVTFLKSSIEIVSDEAAKFRHLDVLVFGFHQMMR